MNDWAISEICLLCFAKAVLSREKVDGPFIARLIRLRVAFGANVILDPYERREK